MINKIEKINRKQLNQTTLHLNESFKPSKSVAGIRTITFVPRKTSGLFVKSAKASLFKKLDTLYDTFKEKSFVSGDTPKEFNKPAELEGHKVTTSKFSPAKKIKFIDARLNIENIKSPKMIAESATVIMKRLRDKRRDIKLNSNMILEGIKQTKQVVDNTISSHPYISLLNESEILEFNNLDNETKSIAEKNIKINYFEPTAKEIRDAINESIIERSKPIPAWIKNMPQQYKSVFESLGKDKKMMLETRASYFDLSTQEQINDFWKTSGLKTNQSVSVSINESVVKNDQEDEIDSIINYVSDYFKK